MRQKKFKAKMDKLTNIVFGVGFLPPIPVRCQKLGEKYAVMMQSSQKNVYSRIRVNMKIYRSCKLINEQNLFFKNEEKG